MDGNHRPVITGVHASERFVTVAGSNEKVARIELTPIIDVVTDPSYKSSDAPFEISFNYAVKAFSWGSNDLVFVSGNREERIVLSQRK